LGSDSIHITYVSLSFPFPVQASPDDVAIITNITTLLGIVTTRNDSGSIGKLPTSWRPFTPVGDVPLTRPISYGSRTRYRRRSLSLAFPFTRRYTNDRGRSCYPQPPRRLVRTRQCHHQRMAIQAHGPRRDRGAFTSAKGKCTTVSLVVPH